MKKKEGLEICREELSGVIMDDDSQRFFSQDILPSQ
jgi:hypothetical protein